MRQPAFAFLLLLMMAPGEAQRLTRQVAESGRVLEIATFPSERVSPRPQIAPGVPPLLSFRFYEGKVRHGYDGLGLMLDDAGH